MQSIVLGTAQWGLDYGVTNSWGRMTEPALLALLDAAQEAGIRTLDTANAYGDAEERIGAVAQGFAVVSKVSCAGLGSGEVLERIRESLRRLGRESLQGCLVHDWPSLTPSERVEASFGLQLARESGLVETVGVSGYEAEDFRSALEVFPSMDIAQGPLNVLDQRLDVSGALKELSEAGVSFEARSVFLQGLLLSTSSSAEGHVSRLVDHPSLERCRSAADDLGISRLQLALSFIRAISTVDRIVIGVTSKSELQEILTAWESPQTEVEWAQLQSTDLDLLDPRRWTQENGSP